jgi:hypothetical protein
MRDDDGEAIFRTAVEQCSTATLHHASAESAVLIRCDHGPEQRTLWGNRRGDPGTVLLLIGCP